MELNKQIKKYRTALTLSQEELAEQLYVTRQSVSNWETSKNYPDIHSLLLMSTLFGVTLDELVKGDLNQMKEEIKAEDIKKFSRYGGIYTLLLPLTVIAVAPLWYYLGIYGVIIWLILFAVTLVFAIKLELLKKTHDIQTYREIVAFMNGERLDEIVKKEARHKRPLQIVIMVIGSGIVGFLISYSIMKLMNVF